MLRGGIEPKMNHQNSNRCGAACLLLPTLLTPLMLGTMTTLLGAPRAAFAGQVDATSRAAGVPLPSGATPMENAEIRNGMGMLLGAWAKERSLDPQEGPAEVWIWSGDAYKPGRAALKRSGLQRTLTDDDYAFEAFARDQVYVSPFEESYGIGHDDSPLKLSPWDRQEYLIAIDKKRGRAIVGVWIDQEKQKRLILALAPTRYQRPPEEAPLPEVPAGALLVKDYNDAMKEETPSKAPAFPSMTARPGTIRGMVKDSVGRPLAGARVIVESSALGGFRTSVTATTDSRGVYQATLPEGSCRVVMSGYTLPYKGRSYALPLHPADGACEYFNSRKGHVEHLVLRTYGIANPAEAEQTPSYGRHYYGGHIRLMWLSEDIPPGGTIEIALTPQGPLADGSKGRPLIFRLPNNRSGGDLNLNDIPIGQYLLTATLRESGEAHPIRVRKARGEGAGADSLLIDFEPEASSQVFTHTGGIKRFDITLKL